MKHEPLTPENFRETILEVAEKELSYRKNVWNYLNAHHLPNLEKFAQDLMEKFPAQPDYTYVTSHHLPSEEFVLHLKDVSWDPCSSTKPAPFQSQTALLLDEYLTNSFITDGDPLLLAQGPDVGRSEFWTVFVKGSARSGTALFLASLAMRYQWGLATLHPALQKSLTFVRGKRSGCNSDTCSIALENARLSARGSLRKQPGQIFMMNFRDFCLFQYVYNMLVTIDIMMSLRSHCCLTWLGKMIILKKAGLSPSAVLREWNNSCTKAAQLQGHKSTALLALLDLSPACIQVLLDHVSLHGSQNSAFTETIWASKKIMPGGMPKGFSREWNSRLTMTTDGFLLLLRYVCGKHKPGSRCKVFNAEMEDMAMVCQLLVSLVAEVESQLPVAEATLQKEVFQMFLDGDINLETQLQGALSDKKSNLQPADIPALKEIMARHMTLSSQTMVNLGKASTSITAGQIEQQEWNMALASLQHDLDLYQVWLTRSRDREAAMFHQNLQWRLTRQSKAKSIAECLMSPGSESCQFHFGVVESAGQIHKQVTDIQKRIIRMEQISPENLLTVCILNWAAPNLFCAPAQPGQWAESAGKRLGRVWDYASCPPSATTKESCIPWRRHAQSCLWEPASTSIIWWSFRSRGAMMIERGVLWCRQPRFASP